MAESSSSTTSATASAAAADEEAARAVLQGLNLKLKDALAHSSSSKNDSTMAESSSTTSAATSTAAADEEAARAILEGLKDALAHRSAVRRNKSTLTPEARDELLQESFPNIPTSSDDDDSKMKDLTAEDYNTLRTGLQKVIISDAKHKMSLLQEQLSEYHVILEDVIAYKSRCEQLEKDKEDLIKLCQEACQVRDDRIALLEKAVVWLRHNQNQNEEQGLRSSHRSVSSGSNESTCNERRDGQPDPQANSNSDHQFTQPGNKKESEQPRRLTLSPANTEANKELDGFDTDTIEPLPYQDFPPNVYVPLKDTETETGAGRKRSRPC